MPLERLMLILICVVAAAAATIWIASLLFVGFTVSPFTGLAALTITALVAYIVVRVIAERVTSKEDNHYDRIEK